MHPQTPRLEKQKFTERESPPFSVALCAAEPRWHAAVSSTAQVRDDQHAGNTMIEISHLSKRYGELTAVDDISFNVQPGEVLGFLGPNGAGKSTTMKMITGFLAPTSGSVRV